MGDEDSDRTYYIVCIGDRVSIDGDQDVIAIETVLNSLKDARGRVILRSTILPSRLSSLRFHYYVPEFLRERCAVEDCLNPSWVVIGRNCDGELPVFLEKWIARANKVFIGNPSEAAYIKYLSNIWNAVRIAFVNEFGAAIGAPSAADNLPQINRIINFVFGETAYLRFGRAYGGPCLPKDVRAFLKSCVDDGNTMALLKGVCAANTHHALRTDHSALPEWFSSPTP